MPVLFFLFQVEISARESSLKPFYKKVIEILASDSLQGREVSTIYEDKAADYITDQFENFRSFKTHRQYFQFTNPENGRMLLSKNIYCYIDHHASKTILISAHYDHIGLGGSKSLSYHNQGQVHHGADDNASGVALMLGLAKNFKHWRNKKYNYLFVAYSAHEVGLFGSSSFKKFAEKQFKHIILVMNFDMVGRLDSKERILSVYGYSSLAKKDDFFRQTPKNIKYSIDENDKVIQTDAGTFASSGVYALSFTTGIHEDYHKISDEARYINLDGIEVIQHLLEQFLDQWSL